MRNQLANFGGINSSMIFLLISIYAHVLPLFDLKAQLLTAHNRWQAFRGESTDPKQLLFSVKKSGLLQFLKTKLDVFLATNTKEEVCDFKIEGSWMEKSCVIYASNSVEVAKVNKKTFHFFLSFLN